MGTKKGLPEKRRMRHDRHFVDELAGRAGERIGRMIRVTSIESNVDQPRSLVDDLDELVKSIERHGILEPLLVRKTQDGRFQLVSGERRFKAATEAGLDEVPCVELTVSDEQAVEIALVENLQRKDLSAFEEAEGFQTLVKKYKYTHEQVAVAIGKSRVTVSEGLKLLAIPDEIRQLCRHADITAKGVLLEIAREPNIEAMRRLVKEIMEQGLDRRSIRERRQESADEADEDPKQATKPSARPFVMRFRYPEQGFNVALSFKAGQEPDSGAVISALEEMIRQLKEDMGHADA